MPLIKKPEIAIRQAKRTPWLKWLRRIHAWVGLWGGGVGIVVRY